MYNNFCVSFHPSSPLRNLADTLSARDVELQRAQKVISGTQESLQQAELRLAKLEEENTAMKANELTITSHNESLTESNTFLRQQLDELMPKLSAASKECGELRSSSAEQRDRISDLEQRVADYDGKMRQMRELFEAIEAAESDVTADVQRVSDLLSANAGANPLLVRSGADDENDGDDGGDDVNRDYAETAAGPTPQAGKRMQSSSGLFASPPLQVTRSPLILFSEVAGTGGAVGGGGGSGDSLTTDTSFAHADMLSTLRQGVSNLKLKSSNLAAAYQSTLKAAEKARREQDQQRRETEKLKEKLTLLSHDREGASAKLEQADRQRAELRQALHALEKEKEVWLNDEASNNQRMTAVLRDMDNRLLEALARANDAVAGVVPISADALPELSISQSLIKLDESRVSRMGGQSQSQSGAGSSQLNHSTLSAGADVGAGGSSNAVAMAVSNTRLLQTLQETTAVSVLSVSVNEVDRATDYLNSVIRKLVAECKAKTQACHAAEQASEQSERAWTAEREKLNAAAQELEDEVATLKEKLSSAAAEAEAARNETERTQHKLQKLGTHNADLEAELKHAGEQAAELRGSLQESEHACMDLRSKLRNAQGDLDKRGVELAAMSEQLVDSRRRISEGELHNERTGSQVGRLQAEKEALDNVRRSLEAELERSRAELASLRAHTKQLDEEHRNAFEVEKLLAALGNTLNQIVPPAQNALAASAGMSFVSQQQQQQQQQAQLQLMSTTLNTVNTGMSEVSDFQHETVPMRVEAAVKRLTQLRHWAREETRSRRTLEGQQEALSQEVGSMQAALDEAQQQLKDASRNVSQREGELRAKNKEVEELQHELQRLKGDFHRAKLDDSNKVGLLEDEKRSRESLLDELRAKETHAARLRADLESRAGTISRLQEQVRLLEAQVADARAEAEQRSEQVRVAKANSEKLLGTIEQLERGGEADRADREEAERRLAQAEVQVASLTRTQARNAELERQLERVKAENKQSLHDKLLLDERQHSLSKELDASRKKAQSLEHRLNAIMQEKNSFVDEVAETRRKIALAKEYAEQERAQRMKADASIEALKRSEQERRVDLVGFAQKAEEVESLQSRAEEEKRSLRGKISELRLACDEKESQRQADLHDRKRLEKDVKQLKSALAKRTAELESTSSYSSLLRSEGRQARQQVLQAVAYIREVLTIVRIDAQAAGFDLRSPDAKSTVSGRSNSRSGRTPGSSSKVDAATAAAETGIPNNSQVSYDDALSLGLAEALGVNDLMQALSALRSGMAYVTAAPEHRQALHSRIEQLEKENEGLQKELTGSESQRQELVGRYKLEIQSMHAHITELRRSDSKNPHLTHQISVLESALQQERERREKAVADVQALKGRMDSITREIAAAQPHPRSSEVS